MPTRWLAGICLVVVLLVSSCATLTAPPVWLNHLDRAFPPEEFLAFTGTGADLSGARSDSLAQMVSYFGLEVGVEVESSVNTLKGDSFSSDVTAKALNTLYAVRYSQPFDVKGETKVVAYLNRKEALASLLPERDNLLRELELLSAKLLSPPLWSTFENLVKVEDRLAAVRRIDSLIGGLGQTKPDSSGVLAAMAEGSRAVRVRLGVQLQVTDSMGLVASSLGETLTALGLAVGSAGLLKAQAELVLIPGKAATIKSSQWTLTVLLLDEQGTWFAGTVKGNSTGSSRQALRARIQLEVDKYLRFTFLESVKQRVRATGVPLR